MDMAVASRTRGVQYLVGEIHSEDAADATIRSWEDPEDYSVMGEKAYEGASGEDRAQKNLRRFAEAHMIPISPWKEGEKVESMGGGTIWWECKDGNKLVCAWPYRLVTESLNRFQLQIQPGDIEVSSIASRVSNGEVWIVKKCLNMHKDSDPT